MIFLFENVDDRKNAISCKDINPSGIMRFTASPLLGTLGRYKTLRWKFNNYDPTSLVFDNFRNRKKYTNYIISTGVTHAPWDWCGYTDLDKIYDRGMMERKTIFAYLHPKQLGDLRKRKAFLLLDQSHEGYHTDWLFDWFHDVCKKYEVDADRVIYVTGNLAVEQQYSEWCAENNPSHKMCVIPHIHFEEFIYDSAKKQTDVLPTFENHVEYKTKNLDTIKTYNCFQKRNRPHRIWMFYELYKHGLLDDGINSMNFFVPGNSHYEGRAISQEEYQKFVNLLPMYPRTNLEEQLKKDFEGPMGGSFERDLYHQETRQSWVSVVSEASFAERTCFISEKSFKPIAARHPFIMYGNKHSLKYLKELGYKTFENYIDESYDSYDTWQRLDAIIALIKKLKSMPEQQKLKWFIALQEVLEYNFNVLKDNTTKILPSSVLKIQNHVG